SLLKSGKVKGLRFSTLEAICRFLECQPGDLLEFVPDETSNAVEVEALRKAG
ncbi:MAG TPA: helix-turn-helix domain-containing protein, partial [Phenylobacterium sp.]